MDKNNLNNFSIFYDFINEAKNNEGINVIVLSGSEGISPTSESFMEECKKRKIKCNIINISKYIIEKNAIGGHNLFLPSDRKNIISIDPFNTVIIPRRGVLLNTRSKEIMREFEESRYFCLNTLESMEDCEDKYRTLKILEKENLPVPRYAIIDNENSIDDALKKIGGKFPIVMKLLSGSQGIGVSIVDSYESLKSVYQTIAKVSLTKEVLLQEKIESNYDIRIQVLTKKIDPLALKNVTNCEIIGSMKRLAVKDDFRTNYSLGGKVKKIKLTREIEEIASKAANALGCHWCGVDIMIDNNTKRPYILEVNASPGTEGISEVMGEPIVDKVIDFITNKENWYYPGIEVGYLENVYIENIGEFVAKFDTGNGSNSCTIHADSFKEKNKYLYWKIGNKSFKNKIIDYSLAEIGEDRLKRPIIELGMYINDIYIEKIEVSPSDRTNKSTPLLINRKTMRKMGLIVNPHKVFVMTEKPIDGFSPKHSRGDKNAGIKISKIKK